MIRKHNNALCGQKHLPNKPKCNSGESKCLCGVSAFVSLAAPFVHLEMSSATGLPRMLAKSFTTMVLPIYWLSRQRDSALFLCTCGRRESWRAEVFILDYTQARILVGDHPGEGYGAVQIRASYCGAEETQDVHMTQDCWWVTDVYLQYYSLYSF